MIKFESVTFRHPSGVVALSDINLEIRVGELTAIMGENGAGKTTLVKHINGLYKPTSGVVTVFGLDTRKASVAELSRRVGIVFQNPDHQLFSENVEKEITFALKNFGFSEAVTARRLEWALEFFGLKEYQLSSPMVLSGGEKKRLCLSTVLAWDPDIVILDEPTVGQDYAQKEKLAQVIRMLLTREKTVVLVSHDTEFIWPLQPRLIVMAGGRVAADGPASSLFRDPLVLETANLMKPQLVDVWSKLKRAPENPFADVFEARRWMLAHTAG